MLHGGSLRPSSPPASAAGEGPGEGPEFVRVGGGGQHGGRVPHPHEWAALPGDIHPAQLAKAVRLAGKLPASRATLPLFVCCTACALLASVVVAFGPTPCGTVVVSPAAHGTRVSRTRVSRSSGSCLSVALPLPPSGSVIPGMACGLHGFALDFL